MLSDIVAEALAARPLLRGRPPPTMRLPRFGKSLQDPQARRQMMEQALTEARAAYRLQPPEKAREAVLQLQDQFDEAGLDRLELLFFAESSIPSDPYWLQEIVSILMRKPVVTPREIPYLLRQALLAPTRLELWQRLFRERKSHGDDANYYTDREHCGLSLLKFFPIDGSEIRWTDDLTQNDAYNLMARSLYDAAVNVVDLGRLDARAREVLSAAMVLYPDRSEVRLQLARIIVQENKRTPETIGIVMEAVIAAPEEIDLKLWVGEALLESPRLYSRGLAMVRQLWNEYPEDRRIFERYVSAIKAGDEVMDEDEDFLAEYVRLNTEDLRALEMLADQFVARSLLSDEALEIYKLAAARSPKRRNYLRLMGKFHASRSEWSEVIAAFDEIRAQGTDTEDVIFPLAMAYAAFERSDEEARGVYRRAIDLGSLNPDVHSLLCRILYRIDPESPESVAQFTQTLTVAESVWAQLGMITHYIATGDAGRAMEAVVAVLAKYPLDREAMRLGGKALATDYSRRQLARLASIKNYALGIIFEEAYLLAPDAGPIALGLARHRMAAGVINLETARLLGEVCRRNPDAVDLRLARADMLWELEQTANAVGIYRELIERWRGAGALPRGITAEQRNGVQRRVAGHLLLAPGPGAADMDILLDAATDPECPAEIILGTARALVDLEIDHPEKLQLLALARRLAPGDPKLERASAEGFAAKGNPRPAVEQVIRMLDSGESDDEVVSMLRIIQAVTKPEAVSRDLVEALQEALQTCGPPPSVLLAGMEVVFMGRPVTADDALLLEALAEIFPRNIRVKRWLARALSESGQENEAAAVLSNLATELPEDDEVVISLAKAHARLGKNGRENLRVAEAAARLAPEDVDLQLHLAAIELNMQTFVAGARRLRRILQTRADVMPRITTMLEGVRAGVTHHPDLLFLLAEVHTRAGRIEQAIALLSRLHADYQKHYVELIHLYEQIILAAPENPRPRIERGILFRLIGQLGEAVEDFREAHRLAPDNADIASEFADVLAQKVHSAAPASLVEILEAAAVYIDLGDEENAFDMVDLALKHQADSLEALSMLATLQLNAGALTKCQHTIRRLRDQQVALPLLQKLARAFSEIGEHISAAQVLTEAIEIAGPARDLLEQLRALHQDQARHSKESTQRLKVLHTLSNRAQGRYELREEIGSGSMGIVYKAYDRELDEIVVLKILPEHFAKNEEALARFRHEAKAARKLAHPNIVRIHDFGEESGRKHISMEYVSGGDLRSMLARKGRFEPEEAVGIIRDVGRALVHAHNEGVLHRDIKTANILITNTGRVKLSDFGIASLLETASRENDATGGATAGAVGTPLYMSPEQFEGLPLTTASDLYSLGIMFYELLSGAPPFIKGSIAYHHQFTPPKPIADLNITLWHVLEKLLAKKPTDRYMRAQDMLGALDQFSGRGVPRDLSINDQITPPPVGGG